MPMLMEAPPSTPIEPVTEILHGVSIVDPYRWLEDQDSPRTREWLDQQRGYARAYLDNIPGRQRIRKRITEFLAVETYDSLQRVGSRYFFRKRLPDQEQPCIYMREGADGEDQLLLDPSNRGLGNHIALRPLLVSPNGRLLLYQVKEGGEQTGTFEILDIESRATLPDILPRGYLRGFVFAPDGRSFYYSHEVFHAKRPFYRAAYHHVLGTPFEDDQEIFYAGEEARLRLCLVSGQDHLGVIVYKLLDKIETHFYLKPFLGNADPELILSTSDYSFAPLLLRDRIIAVTNRNAPKYKIVEVNLDNKIKPQFIDIVPESNTSIRQFVVSADRIFVSYLKQTSTEIKIFDLQGRSLGSLPVSPDATVRLFGGSQEEDEFFLETESFTRPSSIYRYRSQRTEPDLWSSLTIPFDSDHYDHVRVWYSSKDGTAIPMFLMGRREILENGRHPVIMTAYGGYGISMTPKFSVLVNFMVERGCLFALPNIRGGSEFGEEWHIAAQRRNRQTAFDDFLSAAEWLITNGRTSPDKLAIFGGSNSGLLVGAAMTQRPELFRVVVCMVPIMDMLRYHLFDEGDLWREEFGTSVDPDDFAALIRYSPYHNLRTETAYPATMIISGDADGNCNPLHARKMIARLQASTTSKQPVLLDYSHHRGHSPVLPLRQRIEALTDRIAFLCDQLQLSV